MSRLPVSLGVMVTASLLGACAESPRPVTAVDVDATVVADAVAADATPDALAGTLCDPSAPAVPAVPMSDVAYAAWDLTDCMSEPCLCGDAAADRVRRLLACEAVGVGWYEPFGSVYLRVVGRVGEACVIDVGREIEGGLGVSRCTLPLPVAPWIGLAGALSADGSTSDVTEGIADRCVSTGGCCVLDGCPNPCTTEPACPMGRSDSCAVLPP